MTGEWTCTGPLTACPCDPPVDLPARADHYMCRACGAHWTRTPRPAIRALLDLDGVLAAFDLELHRRALAAGVKLDIATLEDQTARYLTDHVPDRDQRRTVRGIVDAPGWFRDLPVIPGAQAGVEAMLAAGWDVWAVTKPLRGNPECGAEKAAWIHEHFPDIRNVCVVDDKSAVKGTFLLDDAPAQRWFADAAWYPVVFDAPYNAAGSKWEWMRHRWNWTQPIGDLLRP